MKEHMKISGQWSELDGFVQSNGDIGRRSMEADGDQNCKLRLTNPIKSNKIKQLCIAC